MDTLLEILKGAFCTEFYLKVVLTCPIIGWLTTVILFDLEKKVFHQITAIDKTLKRKLICWMDLSALYFALVSFLKVFF